MLKTPILQTEHIRGVEPKADFLIAGGTDFLRSDPEYDLGITGCMKIHHFAESLAEGARHRRPKVCRFLCRAIAGPGPGVPKEGHARIVELQ